MAENAADFKQASALIGAPARQRLASALRAVLDELARVLGSDDPSVASNDLVRSLAGWRETLLRETRAADPERARMLEHDKLQLMGRVSTLQKERDDLREHNARLRDELVRLNKRDADAKQAQLQSEFETRRARDEARKLDHEVRELRRKLRELEGGPPLSAAEAAPQSKGDADADEGESGEAAGDGADKKDLGVGWLEAARRSVTSSASEARLAAAEAAWGQLQKKEDALGEAASDAAAAQQAAASSKKKRRSPSKKKKNAAAPAPATSTKKKVTSTKKRASNKKATASKKKASTTATTNNAATKATTTKKKTTASKTKATASKTKATPRKKKATTKKKATPRKKKATTKKKAATSKKATTTKKKAASSKQKTTTKKKATTKTKATTATSKKSTSRRGRAS